MATVYRIEDKQGRGCYRYADNEIERYLQSHVEYPKRGEVDKHPGGAEDFPHDSINNFRNHKHGFDTLDKLHDWFTEDELEFLFSKGYFIFKLEVKSFISSTSGRQCYFKEENVINRYCIQAEIA